MENIYILQNSYQSNNENAKKFIEQNNLPAAKEAFKKALQAAIKLIEQTTGAEKARYTANATVIAQMIEKINEKLAAPPAPENGQGQAQDGDKPKASLPTESLSVEEAIAQLNALEGLQTVKEQVNNFVGDVWYNQQRKQFGLPVGDKSYHMVYTGNPGTGKTTVARIMAQILRALGLVSKGQLVEVSRTDLVAGFVGQTAQRTQKCIDEALGGVLFIDEAYTLNKGGNDFGQEAIDTILKAMEDHRDDLVVIVAGYDDLMGKFIDSNPGLKSRFTRYINFTDYNAEGLFNIYNKMCAKYKYTLTPEATQKVKKYFEDYYENRDKNFGNARDVRTIFEQTETKHGRRILSLGVPMTEELVSTITVEDLPFIK